MLTNGEANSSLEENFWLWHTQVGIDLEELPSVLAGDRIYSADEEDILCRSDTGRTQAIQEIDSRYSSRAICGGGIHPERPEAVERSCLKPCANAFCVGA